MAGDGLLPAAFRGVDGVAEVFAGLETNVLRSRNPDLFVCAGIAALARLALADGKAAQAGNGAALAALTRLGNVADERIERGPGFLLRNAGLLGNRVDDVTPTCPKKSLL